MSYTQTTLIKKNATGYVDINAFITEVEDIYGADTITIKEQLLSSGNILSSTFNAYLEGSEYVYASVIVWRDEEAYTSNINNSLTADERSAADSAYTITRSFV